MKILLLSFLLLIGIKLNAQENNSIPMIGSTAPSFTAETTNGTFNFPKDFDYSWKILFSHPQDFTPVCTSEILEIAKMQDEFESYAVKVAIISTDTKENHFMWKKSMEEYLSNDSQQFKINFPFIADDKLKVAKLYGMVPGNSTKTVRGVFIIDPDNIIEAVFFYPMNIGRGFDEIIRTVQALQTARASKLLTPANWKPGNDLVVPYHPYTKEQQIKDPSIICNYYSKGSFLWYKKRLY